MKYDAWQTARDRLTTVKSALRLLLGALVGGVVLAAYIASRPQELAEPAPLEAPPPSGKAALALPEVAQPRSLPTLAEQPRLSLRRIDLTVAGGLLATFTNAGLTAELLDEFDSAFISRYDLFAQLTDGRKLTLWLDRDIVVAAEVETNFGVQRAALYRGARAQPGWYDARGLSLAGPLLGRPVQLSKVTSAFGQRFHPITGDLKKHAGLDYGVPLGTPVRAAGDGTVRVIANEVGGGNVLKLSHKDGWESWYLHLDSFAKGLKKAATIKQGELVAFSGNTGKFTTGPHLHYELRIVNIAMDPTKTLPLPSRALGPLALPEHQAFLRSLP